MENINDKLSAFLGKKDVKKSRKNINNDNGTKIIQEKDGLLERIDVKFITEDGKQLLTEVY
jgi:hypothetical protein